MDKLLAGAPGHGTFFSIEEDALAIGLLLQSQSAPVLPRARELLNEVALAHLFEGGEAGDFVVR